MNPNKLSSNNSDEEPEDFSSILKKSTPKAFDFRSLMPEAFFNAEKNEADEDDEEDEKTSKKKKKVAASLKNIFAQKLEHSTEEKENTAQSTNKDRVSNNADGDAANETEEISEASFSDINSTSTYEQQAQAVTEEEHVFVQPEAYQPPAEEDEGVDIEKEDIPKPLEKPRVESPQEEVHIPVPEYAPPIIYTDAVPDLVYEKPTSRSETETVQAETQVENTGVLPALLAFGGAELLSRRRDNNIRESINDLSKKTDQSGHKIQEKISALKGDAESLNSILNRRSEELRQIPETPSIINRPADIKKETSKPLPLFTPESAKIGAKTTNERIKPNVDMQQQIDYSPESEKVPLTEALESSKEKYYKNSTPIIRNQKSSSISNIWSSNSGKTPTKEYSGRSIVQSNIDGNLPKSTEIKSAVGAGVTIAMLILLTFVYIYTKN